MIHNVSTSSSHQPFLLNQRTASSRIIDIEEVSDIDSILMNPSLLYDDSIIVDPFKCSSPERMAATMINGATTPTGENEDTTDMLFKTHSDPKGTTLSGGRSAVATKLNCVDAVTSPISPCSSTPSSRPHVSSLKMISELHPMTNSDTTTTTTTTTTATTEQNIPAGISGLQKAAVTTGTSAEEVEQKCINDIMFEMASKSSLKEGHGTRTATSHQPLLQPSGVEGRALEPGTTTSSSRLAPSGTPSLKQSAPIGKAMGAADLLRKRRKKTGEYSAGNNSAVVVTSATSASTGGHGGTEKKLLSSNALKEQRARRNRESAKRSRLKHKLYLHNLESKHCSLSNENQTLKLAIEQLLPPLVNQIPTLKLQLQSLFDTN